MITDLPKQLTYKAETFEHTNVYATALNSNRNQRDVPTVLNSTVSVTPGIPYQQRDDLPTVVSAHPDGLREHQAYRINRDVPTVLNSTP